MGGAKRRPMARKRVVVAVCAIAVAVLAVALAFAAASARDGESYERAAQLEESGDLAGAYALFDGLGGYSDARDRAAAIAAERPGVRLAGASRGDYVEFGAFEQDGDAGDGAEPLWWIILDEKDGRFLLISEKVLAGRAYHEGEGDIVWRDCSLRAWLNGEFLQGAFTDAERSLVAEVENENPDEDVHGTEGGPDTADRVFALSEPEAAVYLGSEERRFYFGTAAPTDLAVAQGVSVHGEGEEAASPWWLRSPGTYPNSAVFVEADGTVNPNGAIVTNDYFCGVRPAMWVDAG